MTDDELPPGGEVLDEDPPWEAWRPEEIARLLAGVPVPWYVASGWAADAVPAGPAGWALRRVHPGHRWIEMLEPE